MNVELARLALEKVGSPQTLVNLISRRVRQLNSGGGAVSRPLIGDTAGMGVADIALKEIVDGKMGWEAEEEIDVIAITSPKKKKS